MLPSSSYRPENVYRSKYAYAAFIIAAVALCAYSLAGLAIDSQRLHGSRIALSSIKSDRIKLLRQSDGVKHSLATVSATGVGGLEPFAVRLSDWAESHGIQLESLAPLGDASVSDIKLGGATVGRWASRNVQIKGRGDLRQVMALIDQLRAPWLMPAQLNSFSLISMDDGKSGKVVFHFALTIYEKKSGAG
jgi:hypothetical protein